MIIILYILYYYKYYWYPLGTCVYYNKGSQGLILQLTGIYIIYIYSIGTICQRINNILFCKLYAYIKTYNCIIMIIIIIISMILVYLKIE